MSFGRPPFTGCSLNELKFNILTKEVSFPLWCDHELKNIIKNMLQKDK